MVDFIQLRNTRTGIVDYYPPHFLDHPVFGRQLELYNPDEYEEDKVTVDAPFSLNRERVIATPIEDEKPAKKTTSKDEK